MLTAPSWSADSHRTLTELRTAALYPGDGHAQLTDQLSQLDRLLRRHAPAAGLDRYLAVAVDHDQRRDRWATIITVQRLGLLDAPAKRRPSWPEPDGVTKRVLRPLEAGLLRMCATDTPVKAATIALFEAGATSTELHQIDADHLDRDDEGRWVVQLPGDTTVWPRVRALPTWAAGNLDKLVAARPAPRPLVYAGSSTDPAKRQCAVLTKIKTLLHQAGLGHDHTVAPESIRHTAARRCYDRAEPPVALDQAAAFLGIDGPDRVARRIDVHPGIDPVADRRPTVCWSNPLA